MALQSERLLALMQKLRLPHMPACYEALAEEAGRKNQPYLDFLESLLEAEGQAKFERNVRLKTMWANFSFQKRLDQFDFAFQPSIDERKIRELAGLRFLENKENVILLGPPGVGKTQPGDRARHGSDLEGPERVLHHHARDGGAVDAGSQREPLEGKDGDVHQEGETADH
jgi:hypothetical protein